MAHRPFPSYWMFRDRNGHWRWNFAGESGTVTAASSVAYYSKEGCVRAIRAMRGSGGISVWGPEADVHPAPPPPPAAAPAFEMATAE